MTDKSAYLIGNVRIFIVLQGTYLYKTISVLCPIFCFEIGPHKLSCRFVNTEPVIQMCVELCVLGFAAVLYIPLDFGVNISV
jgi:hypothetical protein